MGRCESYDGKSIAVSEDNYSCINDSVKKYKT